MFAYDLTEPNRLVLRRVFSDVPRVDIGIDSVIEGHMGQAFVDDLDNPRAFKLQIEPFCYFAGNFGGSAAIEMIKKQETYFLIMVCPEEALRLAREHFGDRLLRFPRYSFSSERLSVEHVGTLLGKSPFRSRIVSIDAQMLDQVSRQPDHFLDISAFASAEDFLARGLGYAVKDDNALAGVAYSSLVNDTGIEVSIYVESTHRRRGMATALGCALVKACLERSVDPHWDAANVESCTLAEKLGYVSTGTYDAYCVSR